MRIRRFLSIFSVFYLSTGASDVNGVTTSSLQIESRHDNRLTILGSCGNDRNQDISLLMLAPLDHGKRNEDWGSWHIAEG